MAFKIQKLQTEQLALITGGQGPTTGEKILDGIRQRP